MTFGMTEDNSNMGCGYYGVIAFITSYIIKNRYFEIEDTYYFILVFILGSIAGAVWVYISFDEEIKHKK